MALERLFEAHHTLRAVIDSGLEGRLGRIVTRGVPAHAARIDLGCYAIFGGDAAAPEAEELARGVTAPLELLAGEDQGWRDLLQRVHGRKLEDRPMRTFSPHALDREHLRTMERRLPAGFSIEPLDAERAARLDSGITPHGLQTFTDAAHLAAEGIGFGVFSAGELASAASSYAISKSRVEVAISTREAHRGRGLARAVAATILLHCLDAGLRPEWSASNPVSKRLALDLGYRPAALCDVMFLTE